MSLFLEVGKISKIPIFEEVQQGTEEINEGKFLSAFSPKKVGGTREKKYYSHEVLKELAHFFNIDSSSFSKEKLSQEILKAWKKRYPKDFEEM